MKENNLEIIRKEKRESAIMAVISLTGLITAILLTPEPVPPLFGTAYGKEISDFINSIKDKIVNFEYIKENANQGFSELIAAYASTSAFFYI